jgi:glycosyltransferase involved in cell wall biosynthesis
MDKTNVLHIIARMNVGGASRYVGELIENIPSSKLATGYVQGLEVEDMTVENPLVIRVNYLGRRLSPINDFRAWRELCSIVRLYKPEIIHTHTFKAGLIGRLIPGTHVRVHTYHGHLFNDQSFSKLAKRVIITIERYLASKTDMLISVGRKVGEDLRKEKIGKENTWFSIPPGIQPPKTFEQQFARTSLGMKKEKLYVGWLARMATVKNPNLFLEVARCLPNVQFIMAGGGELLQTIRDAAPENVQILGWVDAPMFWSAIDVAISTSDNEGIPIALIEAQMSGIPVVATDVGSTEEVVVHGKTGLLTNKTVSEICVALKFLINDKALREKMGKEARMNSTSQFNKLKMVEAHFQIYENLRS